MTCSVCGFTPPPNAASPRSSLAKHRCGDGPKRDCTHTRVSHQHGTSTAYRSDGCRCDACRAAYRSHRQRLERRTERSRWVDAHEVREHLQSLIDDGATLVSLVRRSGYSELTLRRLLNGERTRVWDVTRSDLLALTHGAANIRSVDASGTTRRLRALAARGWGSTAVSVEMGRSVANKATIERLLHGSRTQVTPELAADVSQVYERLWDQQPPMSTPHERATASRMMRRARRDGWLPPAAFDDHELDLPLR